MGKGVGRRELCERLLMTSNGAIRNHHQRWARTQRAALLDQYRALQAEGVSQRQAAKVLHIPRTTLQAWHVWQERLDACPQVVAFFESGPGLAFLHRLVMALHVVFVEIGACGIRLICRFLELTALHRFVGASYGTQHQVNRHVEEAIVAYKHEETARLAQGMPPQEITVTQDETFTGGLCLVAIEPVSNYILLEQVAEARDHDTWNEAMAGALAPLKCHCHPINERRSPGTPGLCRTPPRRASLAGRLPCAAGTEQGRLGAAGRQTACSRQGHYEGGSDAHTDARSSSTTSNNEPVKRGPGRPLKVATSLEQAAWRGGSGSPRAPTSRGAARSESQAEDCPVPRACGARWAIWVRRACQASQPSLTL